jgi:hypothetical protein
VTVTTTNQDASTMRARAQRLRALAVELERTPGMTLEQIAGVDTWRTPRAEACFHLLVVDQTRILHAADDLRWTALQLERGATDVERELARISVLEAS